MSKQVIKANPDFKLEVDRKQPYLNVAEFFTDTIQGEGVSVGIPATFLRLQHCTLDCIWCDSTEVWKKGNPYTPESLLELMKENDVLYNITNGNQHLVITGGSPIRQDKNLVVFLNNLFDTLSDYTDKIYIEVENECTLMPSKELASYISQWNNSPKLSNSGMKKEQRVKPDVLKYLSSLPNSWFKFVVSNEEDWKEIEEDYLPYIKKEQIILMPCGENQEQLLESREVVIDLVIREGVRYSDRLHIIAWDRKTGV